MKVGLMYANAGPYGLPDQLEDLARTAEQVGVESIWTVEHSVVPVGYRSEYPYSETGRMPGPEDLSLPDPLLSLAFAAAVTKTLRLGSGVLILPQRHPVYVAKELATLDMLSGGRALLGVGIGWLKEEFDALGVPFAERAARTEESIQAIRSLWMDGPSTFQGEFYRWEPIHSSPKPVQRPGVPILVGGHVAAAARRAARLGDGFFPVRGDEEHLVSLLSVLRDECGKIGRDPAEIEITTGVQKIDLDAVRRYEDLGVSRLVSAPPGIDKDGIRKGLEDLGDRVLSKLSAQQIEDGRR